MKILFASLLLGLIIICLIPFYGIAQTFKNVCLTNNSSYENAEKIIQDNDGNFYISSIIRPFTSSLSQIGLTKTDSIFNPIYTKIYGDSLITYSSTSLALINDSNLVIAGTGYEFNPNLNAFTTLIKINNLGDTIWSTKIKALGRTLFLKIVHTSGDSLFLLGTIGQDTITNQSLGLLLVYNHMTNSILYSRIIQKENSTITNFTKSIYNTRKKTFFIAGESNDTLSNTTKSFLLECTSNGSVLNNILFVDTINSGSIQLQFSKTTGKVFIGYESNSTNPYSSYKYLILDTLNNVMFAKKIFDGLQNKIFYASAFIDSTQSILLGIGSAILSIDSVGNISSYNYTYQNSNYPFASIGYYNSFVKDNKVRFIGTGNLQSGLKFDIFIVETNYNGSSCTNLPLLETSYNFNFLMSQEGFNEDSLQFFTFSSNISVSSHNLTYLNLCQNVGLSSINSETRKDINISPNPFSDFIHIKSNNAIKKIIINSLVGQNILTKETHLSTEISIDLHYLKAGIYLVSTILEDKTIIYNKIVKQ